MIFGDRHNMRLQDFFLWRSQAANNLPVIANEDDIVGENIIELPEAPQKSHLESDFHRLTIPPPSDRMRLSLLTQAIHGQPIKRNNLTRRQSINSMNSTDLTSDGDLTSPDCSSTLSPPYPSLGNCNFNSTNLDHSKENDEMRPDTSSGRDISSREYNQTTSTSSNLVSPQKRSIAFACPARPAAACTIQPRSNPRLHSPLSNPIEPSNLDLPIDSTEPPRRKTTLKFACPGPPPKPTQVVNMPPIKTTSEFSARPRIGSPMSPFQITPGSIRGNFELFSSTLESRQSQSCDSMDDEKCLENFEATRFHEFASENMQEADWLRRDVGVFSSKLTINDTLKRENEIRRLASEAEAEALEDEEEEEEENLCDDDSDGKHDEDDEDDTDDDDDNEDEKNDVTRYFGGFYSGDDGNERDNELGFADSDESDKEEEFSFWNSGHRSSTKNVAISSSLATSNSSNYSSKFRSRVSTRRKIHAQKITRTATPDLPDSTDFVCGTLDEDRPLEEAYLSCMEARKQARHKLTPQDIDPSFPTSDSEDEVDHHSEASKKISNGNQARFNDVKFEALVDERIGRTSSPQSQVSPVRHSPRKLYSPPPARRLRSPSPSKQRLRSPPPRKLFGNSPKRKQSMNHARQLPIHKKTASNNRSDLLDAFAAGPKATFTKSLPRTPNIFGNEYDGSRFAETKSCDIRRGDHFRRAIDIVKGLEQKRQRRKEKFYPKQTHRKSRGYPDHKTQPGHGAERMRELGLLMAGKVAVQNHYILSA
ncbi:Bgt-2540 [Blumeria graminis f. sp. tritici]|uniref:Bgt-2540 n=2 Tax=Blumeria graminis f. sp. tritici TaxID=62690 RepID=A0A061HNM6_BLUGR|nr:hypothetical protein BGT96224_2540 [Blumeria graminis f. sp. tritici 96224]VCU41136.1 Bgt-2540 [Blumeria graminis f. sp. tritici]